MILVRATGRVLKLSQCGIAVEQRFAFYDQIHTTGMDIKHCLSARAALTLGKDMVSTEHLTSPNITSPDANDLPYVSPNA
jgi:hypothetical protein